MFMLIGLDQLLHSPLSHCALTLTLYMSAELQEWDNRRFIIRKPTCLRICTIAPIKRVLDTVILRIGAVSAWRVSTKCINKTYKHSTSGENRCAHKQAKNKKVFEKNNKSLNYSRRKFSFTVVKTTWVLVRSMYGSESSFLVNCPRSSRLLNLATIMASVKPVTS